MENQYLLIENNTWNYCDNVFGGIATIRQDKVSDFCLKRAEDMRHSNLGNYNHLSKDERERLAQLWEAAKDLPDEKYEYYFNLDDKKEVFMKSVKAIGNRLGINYELIIKD